MAAIMAEYQPSAQSFSKRHALQRIDSPSRSLSLLIHLLGTISMTYSFSYLILYPNHISGTYGWHFQYLTIIGLSLSYTTTLLALFSDLSLSPTLFHTKNLLSTTSAPMSLLITLLYFSLRLIDPELVVPAHLALPLPTDLSFHLNPTVFLLLDLLLLSPPWSITLMPACITASLIAGGYWLWVERCYEKNGFYPYPIFELVGREGRVGLFVGSAVSMVLGTVGLKSVQERVAALGRVVKREGKGQ